MGHHHHEPASYDRAFALGVTLNALFVAVETAAGIHAHSLALLADAGHNLSDCLGLLLAWGAMHLARTQPTPRRTYGLRRTSIMAALANAMLLLVAVGGISWEAIRRLFSPQPPESLEILIVAAIGIGINSGTALLFLRGRHHDANIRGAFLHMAADAAVSLGVVVAAVLMMVSGWSWIDPAMSLVIAVVILFGTWGLLRESLDLALDAVPRGIDPAAVERYLRSVKGVSELHDLHIWGLSTTQAALTAHLVIPAAQEGDELLRRVTTELHDQFGIEHATLQIEQGNLAAHPCGLPCETIRPIESQTPVKRHIEG